MSTLNEVFILPTHPFAEIFPMMSEEKLDELARDIAENGLVTPLTVHNGMLIDGRNRREACRRANVVPAVQDLPAGKSVEEFILSCNSHRRHLNKSQNACLALSQLDYFQTKASDRRRFGKSLELKIVEGAVEKGTSDDNVGQVFGVSGRYVRMASAVQKADLGLFEKVLQGKVKLHLAYKTVVQKQTIESRKKAIVDLKAKANWFNGNLIDFANSPNKVDVVLAEFKYSIIDPNSWLQNICNSMKSRGHVFLITDPEDFKLLYPAILKSPMMERHELLAASWEKPHYCSPAEIDGKFVSKLHTTNGLFILHSWFGDACQIFSKKSDLHAFFRINSHDQWRSLTKLLLSRSSVKGQHVLEPSGDDRHPLLIAALETERKVIGLQC